jgi:hypothetical protein
MAGLEIHRCTRGMAADTEESGIHRFVSLQTGMLCRLHESSRFARFAGNGGIDETAGRKK